MKSIFKLKEYPYSEWNYIKEKDAQIGYKTNKPATRVNAGFYSRLLTFKEWLNYYKFKIL